MVYFLIPVFNEAASIPDLSSALKIVLPKETKHFIFVNDCSTDSTLEMLNKSFESDQITILNNLVNSGPGYSFNKGFEFLLTLSKDDLDLIVTLEGDNTSDLGILPTMHSLATDWKYDLVLASVYAQGGGFSKTSIFRKLISFIANQLLRFIFGIKILTLSSFYRVYTVSIIKSIKSHYGKIITENGFICMLEILIKSIRIGTKIIEVPMILNSDKRIGKSKMKIIKTSIRYIHFLLTKRF